MTASLVCLTDKGFSIGKPYPSDANVEIAYADQGYTDEAAQEQAQDRCLELVVVKHAQAKKGFVLLPRR
jgi:hypothetical protein